MAAEIKQAKNRWFQDKAQEIEHGMVTGAAGRGVWQGLRDIQKGKRGLQPVRSTLIRKMNGEACVGPAEVSQHWQDHFINKSVLNVNSVYEEDVILAVHQHQTRDGIDEPPAEEICGAMMRLKGQKAGG